ALHLRNHDRNINLMQYPKLDYPNIFILKGGYKEFYDAYQSLCSPQNYIRMADEAFTEDLKKYLSLHKSEFKRCYSAGFLRT
ncbi:cell division cycle 25, partial [Blyttiomyces sp. JEL0837]